MNVSIEKCFSLSFGVGKMKFHHCWLPLEKILLKSVLISSSSFPFYLYVGNSQRYVLRSN